MTTALTVTQAKVSNTVTTFVQPSRSRGEILERIREASAPIKEIRMFLRDMSAHLNAHDLQVVEYALARAYHREDRSLTIRQLCVIANQTAEQILHHMKWLGIEIKELISNNDASRVMCRIMD